jgi:hypothetical protein
MRKAKNMAALSRAAERLLVVLSGQGCYAVEDPTQPDTVLVRAERRGVSIGGGRFTAAAVAELVRHALVAPLRSAGERRRFRISEPGSAYLRRHASDQDSAFQVQHQDRIKGEAEVDGKRVAVTIDAAESPLDWLRRRKDRQGRPLVDEACYQAGERLRRDLTLAAMLPSVTSRWDAAPGSAPWAARPGLRRKRCRDRRPAAGDGRSPRRRG